MKRAKTNNPKELRTVFTLGIDFNVDLSKKYPMIKRETASHLPLRQGTTQVIGFRLSKELAKKVKEEAARRGLPLNMLFEEIWRLYESIGKSDRR